MLYAFSLCVIVDHSTWLLCVLFIHKTFNSTGQFVSINLIGQLVFTLVYINEGFYYYLCRVRDCREGSIIQV